MEEHPDGPWKSCNFYNVEYGCERQVQSALLYECTFGSIFEPPAASSGFASS